VIALLPRLKQISKYILWGLVLLGTAILIVLYMIKRLRVSPAPGDKGAEQLAAAVAKASTEIALANAQASVEIAAARAQDTAVKQELQDVTKIQDGYERRRRMADLGRRVGL